MIFNDKLTYFANMCEESGYTVTYNHRIETIYVTRDLDMQVCMYSKDYFMVNYSDVIFKDMILTFKIVDDMRGE